MRVIIETPFRFQGTNDGMNKRQYMREALRDSLNRGEFPFGSHYIYPLVLNDNDPADRDLGISAGLAWHSVADKMAVYEDLGISPGMIVGINNFIALGKHVEYRSIRGKNNSYSV